MGGTSISLRINHTLFLRALVVDTEQTLLTGGSRLFSSLNLAISLSGSVSGFWMMEQGSCLFWEKTSIYSAANPAFLKMLKNWNGLTGQRLTCVWKIKQKCTFLLADYFYRFLQNLTFSEFLCKMFLRVDFKILSQTADGCESACFQHWHEFLDVFGGGNGRKTGLKNTDQILVAEGLIVVKSQLAEKVSNNQSTFWHVGTWLISITTRNTA